MKYLDYIYQGYKPKKGKKGDLICEFHVEPRGDFHLAAGGVAAESSIGTWTELTTMTKKIQKYAAKVFYLDKKKKKIKIAYPYELFEEGNIPQILSSIAGNIFGMKSVKGLKLERIDFPPGLVSSFLGPLYGINGIRKLLRVYDRPLIGTIIKPKLGLNDKEHAKVAYSAWLGGCDIVKDDENLSSLSFNKFNKRVIETLKARDKAEKETGEKKIYMPNVTAPFSEMLKRAKFVKQHGGEYIMVDIITCGWSALQELRKENQELKLVIHAHRAGYAAFSRIPYHGISMMTIANLARIVGVDQLHIGTAVGKMFEDKKEVLENCDILKRKIGSLKTTMPVASGGLNPLDVPALVNIFGKDCIIQAGGGVHGNRLGTVCGAEAMRDAVDAALKGISLAEYAKTHHSLAIAIAQWGRK